jgi:hypothetical protein
MTEPRDPVGLTEVIKGLRETWEECLSRARVERIVTAVDAVAQRLMDPDDPLRLSVLETMPQEAGYSEPMARTVLDGMARDWTREALEGLLAAEFRDPGVLDGFRPGPEGRRVTAAGYPLTFHLGAGAIPGVAATSLIRALLVKSAVLLKPGRGDRALPMAFAQGLLEVDPELSGAVAVRYWPGTDDPTGLGTSITEIALAAADLVVVYGSNDTVQWIGERLPVTTPLRAYRHRLGVGLVGREGLTKDRASTLALDAARAVALFDQRGCVSPQTIFTEEGGELDPREWATLLAGALEVLEAELPSGPVPPEEGASLQQLRGEGELREGAGEGAVLHGGTEAPWTVLFLPEGGVEPTCLNRTVRVVSVPDASAALESIEMVSGYLQTVGVEGLGERAKEVEEALARLGASRIVPFSRVPWPEPWWHHDGEGPLRALVRWTDAG